MPCPSCGTLNPAGKRFCGDCGAALATGCPTCGATNPPGKRFCGDCGTPLAAGTAATGAPASPAPVAERRLVCVMFADLVGFTPFAEERDAEAVREALTSYFAIATRVIELYGGRVEKFIGDAVMALWGAPVAREDDAERAVRAALDLVDAVQALGGGMSARAGVMTGEAAVTLGATNEGMVAGDLVNTAARVQGSAKPGTVLVGEATMHAASAAIAFESAGERELKGKATPVPVWQALRVVAQRGGQGRSDLPEPPFTGRDEEMRLLKDLLAATSRDRRTRLVAITGPAGIGKSRLAWEVEKFLDGIAETVYWHRGRSPSYGEGITFWALGEMVRRRARLAETDDEATTRDRIHETVADYVPDDQERRWVEPALLTLLGLEPAPAGGRDALFAAWRIFFERVAARGTTILLFEDLQWADSGLLDFIEHLLEWAKNVPLMVVTLARPELADRRPDWGAKTRHLTRLALEPLDDAAMRRLLAGFVPGLPDDAVATILARADGMPLYAVETVRALVDDGRLERVDGAYRPKGVLGALAIPDTLRSLIASRLDALDPADRTLVADAAVLGQTFTLDGLAAVAGLDAAALVPRLRVLVQRELFELEADPRSPERGQYSFVQALIREVSYGTLARRDRRALHLAAARWHESVGDETLAGALASHYVAAHGVSDPGPEADAVAVQARLALSGAADRAFSLGAHEQAIAYLRTAIALAPAPADKIEFLLRAARSASSAVHLEDATSLARDAVDLARTAGDVAQLGRALSLLGEVHIDAGDPSGALEILSAAAQELPQGTAPEDVRAEILSNLSRSKMRSGDSAGAIATADLALPIAEKLELGRVLAETLNNKAASLSNIGRIHEARALMQGALDAARQGGHLAAEIRAVNNMGSITGSPALGVELARQAEAIAQRIGNRNLRNWSVQQRRQFAFPAAIGWDEETVGGSEEPGPDADEQASAAGLGPIDESRLLMATGLYRSVLGRPLDAILARLEVLATRLTDQQGTVAVHLIRAHRAFSDGRYQEAYDEAVQSTTSQGGYASMLLGVAIHAVAWGRLTGSAADLVERSDKYLGARGLDGEERAAADAMQDIFEGRTDPGITIHRRAAASLQEMGAGLLAAQLALDLVVLLGPDHPASREALAVARPIYQTIGAEFWIDRALAVAASAHASEPASR